MLQDFNWTAVLQNVSYKVIQSFITVKPPLPTPHYYGQFALSLGKESPSTFLNSAHLIWTPR